MLEDYHILQSLLFYGICLICYIKWALLLAGCSVSAKTKFKLKEHCKVHTHKKEAACPTCGGLFASATKLKDHFARQASLDGKMLQH